MTILSSEETYKFRIIWTR